MLPITSAPLTFTIEMLLLGFVTAKGREVTFYCEFYFQYLYVVDCFFFSEVNLLYLSS